MAKTAKPRMPGMSKRAVDSAKRNEKRLTSKFKDVATSDSFQNFALNLGIGTDNALSSSSYGFNPITRIRTLLEFIHRGSWIGGLAVDLVADDMTRAGIDIQTKLKPEEIDLINRQAVSLRIWPSYGDTVKWGRLYGGAVGFYMIDGQDPSTPLRIESVGKNQFRGILPIDRWQLDPQMNAGQLVNEMGPNFGLPKFYHTINGPGIPRLKIHYTRLFRMEGIRLPYQQRIMEMMWGLSVLERLNDRMIAFDSATQGAAQLAYKAHYRIIKIKDLRQIASAGGKAFQGLMALVEMMRRFQSIEGITMLDSEDEFESSGAVGFTGIAEVLVHFGQQIAGALQIPLVRLFGQSPTGLNSSGESDLRMYYDNVKQSQETDMRTSVHTTFRLIGQTCGVPLDEGFNFEFKSLWQMSDQQQSDVSARDTESVLSAHERGLVSDQVALQEIKQRGRKHNHWTNITDEMIAKAKDEPAPPPEPGEGGTGKPPAAGKLPAIPAKRKPGDAAYSLPMRTYGPLPIVIECPAGQSRGYGWPILEADYGYIQFTTSAEDDEQTDCFIGPKEDLDYCFLISQFKHEKDAASVRFEEYKVMLGFDSQMRAEDCWDAAYRGAPVTRGPTRRMAIDELVKWLVSALPTTVVP